MWSHYSKDHSGICIEYNVADFFDTSQGSIDEYLLQVEYKERSLISFNVYKLYANCCCNIDKSSYAKIQEKLMATKSDDWEYEQEWRLINSNPGGIHIKPSSIKAIYFGLRASLESKMTIRNILFDKPMLFYQMTRSKNGLNLDAIPMRQNSKYWLTSPDS